MEIRLREARSDDVAFARSLYLETMRDITEALVGWDQRRQEEGFAGWFELSQARIIMADGRDVGWLQTRVSESEVFLGSLYVIPALQGRGIGTHVLRELMAQSKSGSKALTLAVMKNNRAIRLYARLGFHTTHEDKFKFYMRAGSSA